MNLVTVLLAGAIIGICFFFVKKGGCCGMKPKSPEDKDGHEKGGCCGHQH